MPDGCLSPNEYIDLELTGTPSALVASPLLSNEYGNVMQLTTGRGIYVPGLRFLSTAVFPTTDGPRDGTQVVYRPAPGVSWTFRYTPTSSATYKWEFVGGAWLYAALDGSINFTPAGSNAWHDGPTPGPDIVSPFDAVLNVMFGARINAAANGFQAQAGVSIGGADPIDANVVANGNTYSASVSRIVQVSVTQNQRLRMQYRDAAASGTNAFDNRFIAVVPVRCN